VSMAQTATILNATGKPAGKVELADALFGVTPNEALVHQAVVRQLAGTRVGTSDTQTRGDVTGGGRKPWRQKGTGRARQGSRRSPQWRGGGVVFGPHPRGYEQRMPAKMRRAALKGVLSAKQAAGELRVVEGFALDEIKTRAFIEHLDAWDAQGKVLLVLAARDETVERSCANVREVRVILADSLNVVELLEADTVIFTHDALTRAQEVYA
jgi:large subunit ribosomal protein L4